MGIRIQPLDIEVNKDDPFKNDLLGRKDLAEVLTSLIDSIDGPCAMSLDAPWGAGKSTFFRIWSQHLRNEGFPVVEFNAWETDYSGEPLVALSTELIDGLQANSSEQKLKEIKKAVKQILIKSTPGIIRLATAGILDISPGMEKETGQILSSMAEDKLTKYREAEESITAFQNTLQDMAKSLSEENGHPLIVMIDELDRCRPSYAVELLETAKHLFAVDHVVFVLAINRSQLAHSIKALYGNDFDANGYLGRFFDLDFVLPEPDRKAFTRAKLQSIQLDQFFSQTENSLAEELLTDFFGVFEISLRQIGQVVHRFGLVSSTVSKKGYAHLIDAVVALTLRTISEDTYYQLIRNEITDVDVVDRLFNGHTALALQKSASRAIFEASIITAAREIGEVTETTLMKRYQILDDPHSQMVSDLISSHRPTISFRDSVKLIELLSTDLGNKW